VHRVESSTTTKKRYELHLEKRLCWGVGGGGGVEASLWLLGKDPLVRPIEEGSVAELNEKKRIREKPRGY